MPSTSAFARIFQFGMRLGMRSYTIGSAWWQGDCGPYWGHNAIVRLAPFMAHCHLPVLDRRRAGRRPRAQPRPDRGGADAARRLRGARAGGGRRELRAEPADAGRVHPPRSALVPGQHAVLALPAAAGPAAGQPLSARLRDPDVPRLAGLDRHAADRQRRGRARADAGATSCAATRASPCFVAGAGDVVCAQDRDRDRRADAREAAPRCSAAALRFVASVVIDDDLRHPARADHVGRATRCSWRGCCSAARSAGARRRATITRCRGRSPPGTSGRRPWSGWRRSLLLAATAPAAIPYALFIAGGPLLSIPLAVVTASPALGRALIAARARPAAGGNGAAAGIAGARAAGDRAVAARPLSMGASWREGLRTVRGRRAIAAHLLRRPRAARRHGPPLRPVRAAGRSRLRRRRACRRPHRARSAGSARAWSRSSRSRRWSRR